MTEEPKAVLDIAQQIMTAAGCASLITLDESGLPSARPVRTFPDQAYTKITIPTDEASRKTQHICNNPNIVLSYVDTPTRGYVTILGKAVLNDDLEAKKVFWKEPFSAFWPEGPESETFLLIEVEPNRIEMRSYTQGVGEDPTSWLPVTLERTASGWQRIE